MNRNLLLIIALGVFALLVWQLGLIPFQSYEPKTDVEYLDYTDLTDYELSLLQPILLDFETTHFEEKIEGTCLGGYTHWPDNMEDWSNIEMKGYYIVDNRPTSQLLDSLVDESPYGPEAYCQAPGIRDFTGESGGNRVVEFGLINKEYYFSCSDLDFPVSHCEMVGNCQIYAREDNFKYPYMGAVFYYKEPLPYYVENAHYEERIDGWYTVFDVIPDFDVFCEVGTTITDGFTEYEGVQSGKKIMKTTHNIVAEVPQVVETVDFSLPVDVGLLNNIDITAEFLDSSGTIVESYSGTTPSLQISNLPLRNDGTIQITATADSETQTKTYPVLVEPLRLNVERPDTYRYGKTINLGVSFDQITETRPVTVSIYQDGTLFNTYEGTMPSITINNPKISGDARMLVETDYKGNDYTKEFNVRFDDINLVVDEPGYYEYGHTVHLGVDFSQIDVNAPVNVKIYDKNDKLLEEYSGTMPEVELTEPKALSDCRIEVRVDHEGRTYTKTLNAFFTGYPVATSETSKSYVQYEMDNIEFEVTVTDINNIPLTPSSLSNINPICSLSQGTVDSSSYVHLGDGLYRITSQVTGMGTFLGKLSFTYMTKDFESDNIEINIRENKISIGTSEFPSIGTRDEPIEGIINVFDAKGERFNPDELTVTVYYPDGYTTETIEKAAMTNEGLGRYTFSYTPPQLEKFSFEITANSAGITEGTATASVAVSSAPGEGDEGRDSMGPIISFFLDNIIFILVAFVAAFIIIWRVVL